MNGCAHDVNRLNIIDIVKLFLLKIVISMNKDSLFQNFITLQN
jgi:hypothetical protein